MRILVLFIFFHLLVLYVQAQTIVNPIEINSIYIDTITSEDGYFEIGENGQETPIIEGYLFIRFVDNSRLFMSDMIVGGFPDKKILYGTGNGYFGNYIVKKNGKIVIEYKSDSESFQKERFLVTVYDNMLVFDKYDSGLFWQKTRGVYKYRYIRYVE